MVCRKRSCQIVVHYSLLDFGIVYKRLWKLVFLSVQLVILKPMVRPRGPPSFVVMGRLAPRYVDPYRIIEKKGAVAYKLKLPAALEGYMMFSMCPS